MPLPFKYSTTATGRPDIGLSDVTSQSHGTLQVFIVYAPGVGPDWQLLMIGDIPELCMGQVSPHTPTAVKVPHSDDLYMIPVIIHTTEPFLYRLLQVHKSAFLSRPSHNCTAYHNVMGHNPPYVNIPSTLEEARKVLIMEGVMRSTSADLQDVHFIQWGVSSSDGLLFPRLTNHETLSLVHAVHTNPPPVLDEHNARLTVASALHRDQPKHLPMSVEFPQSSGHWWCMKCYSAPVQYQLLWVAATSHVIWEPESLSKTLMPLYPLGRKFTLVSSTWGQSDQQTIDVCAELK